MQQVVWTFLPTSLLITNSPCANNELTMRAQRAPTAHSLQGIPQHTPNIAPCQVSFSTSTISVSFPTAASPRRRRSIRYFFTRYKQKRQTKKPNYMQQVVWTFLPTSLQITNSPCANNELTMRAQQCVRRSDGANARQAKKQRNTYGMYSLANNGAHTHNSKCPIV